MWFKLMSLIFNSLVFEVPKGNTLSCEKLAIQSFWMAASSRYVRRLLVGHHNNNIERYVRPVQYKYTSIVVLFNCQCCKKL